MGTQTKIYIYIAHCKINTFSRYLKGNSKIINNNDINIKIYYIISVYTYLFNSIINYNYQLGLGT